MASNGMVEDNLFSTRRDLWASKGKIMFVNVENINFSYTVGTPVIRDVSFDLDKGETLAVVGASGCGKSTLLRIISGILPQTEQHLLTGKVSIGGVSPDEYRRSGKLAFMFQEATLMPNLSVKDKSQRMRCFWR
ncbi:ATP-binding cassette domain-containing protein [Leptolyngbya sp. 7M]|uniref:ATP-binding cassette domain-containing protein n=1 Tax=Leptolyngbya sp. 7M TaxID=2812896 RepID=UPI001B8AB1AE|nr:ATP-binding cassette domain-containing protein [Leptolyngbya sp. 7M]QYO64042.1 ATP-binding cassette domain-containing protein [Leptolyngbya sp. 7M]